MNSQSSCSLLENAWDYRSAHHSQLGLQGCTIVPSWDYRGAPPSLARITGMHHRPRLGLQGCTTVPDRDYRGAHHPRREKNIKRSMNEREMDYNKT